MAEPDYQRLGSSHFWAWKNGLKTGMYYLRTKPAADAIKFTVDPKLAKMSIVPGSIKTTIKVASPTGNILSPRSNLKLAKWETKWEG